MLFSNRLELTFSAGFDYRITFSAALRSISKGSSYSSDLRMTSALIRSDIKVTSSLHYFQVKVSNNKIFVTAIRKDNKQTCHIKDN
ncbi:hypothetical protein BpHYR1_020757 [Brachionus plicatilis]|uniref:Uncharacterized protein n=1 Tax=Brachionus plicatilis TaxID=10195 RepID=A0A3M7SKT2_BRAPC|nr:hypothetical protein BpHYR1_020757 [Brachionus plicatilis]